MYIAQKEVCAGSILVVGISAHPVSAPLFQQSQFCPPICNIVPNIKTGASFQYPFMGSCESHTCRFDFVFHAHMFTENYMCSFSQVQIMSVSLHGLCNHLQKTTLRRLRRIKLRRGCRFWVFEFLSTLSRRPSTWNTKKPKTNTPFNYHLIGITKHQTIKQPTSCERSLVEPDTNRSFQGPPPWDYTNKKLYMISCAHEIRWIVWYQHRI